MPIRIADRDHAFTFPARKRNGESDSLPFGMIWILAILLEFLVFALFRDAFSSYQFDYIPFFASSSTSPPSFPAKACPLGILLLLVPLFYLAWKMCRFLVEPLAMDDLPIGRLVCFLVFIILILGAIDYGCKSIENIYAPLYSVHPYILVIELFFLSISLGLGCLLFRNFKQRAERIDKPLLSEES